MMASPHNNPTTDDAELPEAENNNENQQLAEEQGEQDDRLAQLQEENAKLRDQLMRAVAEAENIRKRAQKSQEELAKYAVSDFARDMVSVLENLIRAADSIPSEARADNELLNNLGQGVDLTLKELIKIFERYGIRRLDPMGQKFDHNFHQAIAQVERDDVPTGTVVQVVQAGYISHDRLLRPAMVAVSKQATDTKKVDTVA